MTLTSPPPAPTDPPPASDSPARDRSLPRWWIAALSITLAALTFLVAVYAWLVPDPLRLGPDASGRTGADSPRHPQQQQQTPSADGSSRPPTVGESAAAGSPPAATRIYLDTLPPIIGADRRKELPRDLAGEPEYARSIVIACPSNESDDTASEVTYQLSGRYLDFEASIHVHVPAEDLDARPELGTSHVMVTPVLVTAESNGRLATATRSPTLASPGKPAPTTARVDGALRLQVRVECQSPRMLVILAGATLTRLPN